MSSDTTIHDVVNSHLCMGCGTCAAARPDIVRMADTIAHGRRPVIASDTDKSAARALADTCPGLAIDAAPPTGSVPRESYEYAAWGPVLEVWEGYATDPELRYKGSSGGVVSALSLFCMESEGYAGAVQVRARSDQPLLNESVISRTRDDVLASSASRYAPASPCERLADLRDTSLPHVFVGKPCDVAGAAAIAAIDEGINARVGLTMSIFCAGTPSVAATEELISSLGIGVNDRVLGVRYRGHGWPGLMAVRYSSAETGETSEASISYEQGWGNILQKHTQWRCRMCADHIGEHADLSVGDPWYRPIQPDDPGQSLVVVRTVRGKEILRKAIAAGVLHMEPRSVTTLANSQPNLERTRGAVFGRAIAARLLGAAAPRYNETALHRLWWRALTPLAKVKSILGTVKRMITRGYLSKECAEFIEGSS